MKQIRYKYNADTGTVAEDIDTDAVLQNVSSEEELTSAINTIISAETGIDYTELPQHLKPALPDDMQVLNVRSIAQRNRNK